MSMAEMDVDVPKFAPLKEGEMSIKKDEIRSIRVPKNRLSPLKEHWDEILEPIVEHMKLQIRFNPDTRCVDIKSTKHTTMIGALQKACDFIQAFFYGFNINDAIAILRLDDLYIESFEITDVKMLKGDHLSRAIGRVAGQNGKTKFAIENATTTRIVLQDQKIHVLGSYSNIQLAKNALCSLILGSPPGKVYNQMKIVAHSANKRF